MHWVLFVAGSFWNSNMWSLDPVDPPSTTYSFYVLFCCVWYVQWCLSTVHVCLFKLKICRKFGICWENFKVRTIHF